MQPLAVTGIGSVSPLGIGREALFAGLAAGQPAFSDNEVLEGERYAGASVAQVRGFDAATYLGKKGLRNFDRLTKMLIVSAKHALEDAGIKRDGEFVALRDDRVGVCSATAYGSLDSITEINRVAELEHPRFMNPSRFPNTVINSAAGYVSIWEGLRAPNVTIVDGNCGPLDAVLTADTHLACGRADALLVGGGEVLSEPLFLAFQKLSAETRLGEGAAFLVLERAHSARERGAHVLAEVLGFGASFEPPPSRGALLHASGRALQLAVAAALEDAGTAPGEIDLVISSEGGLPGMSSGEAAGLAQCLPEVPVVAPKQLWGENFAASGALAMAAAVAYLNGTEPAPMLRGSAPSECRRVLVTSLGFYGNVSAVVLRASG